MANKKEYTSVGKPKIGGAIWRAPANTSKPTDVDTDLTGFVNLGYVSTDGLTNSNSKDHSEIKAWGGDTVLMPMTGHTDTFRFTMIEIINSEVLKTVHGDSNVTGTLESGLAVSVDGTDDTEHVYVVDMILNGGVKKRVVIPCGKITAVDDVVYKDDNAIGYPVTITALPDATEKTHYEYIKKPSGT